MTVRVAVRATIRVATKFAEGLKNLNGGLGGVLPNFHKLTDYCSMTKPPP